MSTTIECSGCERVIELKGDGIIVGLHCPDCKPDLYIKLDPDLFANRWMHRATGMTVTNVLSLTPDEFAERNWLF